MTEENTIERLVTLDEKPVEFRTIREKIIQFENRLKEIPDAFFGDSANCPLKHAFADGIYVREIFIPKGTSLTGKIHRHSHPNFLMKGDVSVVTEGGGVERLQAPQSIISKAGTKRVVYAHEDTIWITVHVNFDNGTDLNKIEEFVIAPSYEDYEQERKLLCPG